MSAIAARKARLAAQVDSDSISDSESFNISSPALKSSITKRKGKEVERWRPEKVSRQRLKSTVAPDRKNNSRNLSSKGGKRSIEEASDVYLQEENKEGEENEEDEENSSDSSSDRIIDLEEGETTGRVDKYVETIELAPVCSSYTPIKEGKRNNWYVDGLKKESSKAESSKSLIVALTSGQTLQFVGKASIKILHGSCTISGAVLSSEHLEVVVFAPQNSHIPIIEALSCTTLYEGSSQYHFAANCFSVVLEIKSILGSGIDDIGTACPLVRSDCFTPSSLSSASTSGIEGFYPVFQAAKGLTSSFLPSSWGHALSSVPTTTNTPITCLIKGPKRVGKSTFSRYLLNRLVSTQRSSVAYLETDLGQTEFGPPGMIALHLFGSLYAQVEGCANLVIGPGWTSLRCPLRSHFLGDVTPRDDPKMYIAAIADLLHYYRDQLHSKGISLIINSQGWVKGLGANLLSELEAMVMPTHIFDMMQSGDDTGSSIRQDELAAGSSRKDSVVVIGVEAAPLSLTRDRGLNAVEARTLNLVSYFYSTYLPGSTQVSQRKTEQPRWDFSTSLIQQRPFTIDVQTGLSAGLHVLPKGAKVDRRLQLMALNGSCVALVCVDKVEEKLNTEVVEDSIWNAALSKPTPTLSGSNCVALAIVRSIDLDKGELHLLTPVSPTQIASCLQPTPSNKQLCLVKGAIEIPIWLSLNFQLIEASQTNHVLSGMGPSAPTHLEGVPLSDVPYLDFEGDGERNEVQIVGLGKRRVRRNILRRSQQGPS